MSRCCGKWRNLQHTPFISLGGRVVLEWKRGGGGGAWPSRVITIKQEVRSSSPQVTLGELTHFSLCSGFIRGTVSVTCNGKGDQVRVGSHATFFSHTLPNTTLQRAAPLRTSAHPTWTCFKHLTYDTTAIPSHESPSNGSSARDVSPAGTQDSTVLWALKREPPR